MDDISQLLWGDSMPSQTLSDKLRKVSGRALINGVIDRWNPSIHMCSRTVCGASAPGAGARLWSNKRVQRGLVPFCWTSLFLFSDYAIRPSSRRRSMMLMPNSVLIRLSRYQTMYSSSMPMNLSMETPAKLRLWKNSCLSRPKKPSAAALSGLHPFAPVERVRLLSLRMRIHSGHR